MKLSRIKNKLFIIRKESVHQEDITNVNMYIPNRRTSKYLNAVLGRNLKNDLMWSAHQYSGESIIKFIFYAACGQS